MVKKKKRHGPRTKMFFLLANKGHRSEPHQAIKSGKVGGEGKPTRRKKDPPKKGQIKQKEQPLKKMLLSEKKHLKVLNIGLLLWGGGERKKMWYARFETELRTLKNRTLTKK